MALVIIRPQHEARGNTSEKEVRVPLPPELNSWVEAQRDGHSLGSKAATIVQLLEDYRAAMGGEPNRMVQENEPENRG